MFDKLKRLSKESAVYGISTIVGRFLNFLLVPFYTHVFLPQDYGVISNLYAFIGILNVVLMYGMDSAYLKFASKIEIGDEKDNFSTPYLTVFFSSIILCILIVVLKSPIANILDIPFQFSYLINYSALILFIDAAAVIPFIKLRLERKAKKFAAFKIINISINVLLNLILILKFDLGIEAVLISNLSASFASLLLLTPDIFEKLKLNINKKLIKRLLKFGLPYFPASLAAMLVQGIDRPILSNLTNLDTVAIYNACYKLGIFMMLFVNMFQYAWQPFFLQEAQEKNAKELFSKILTYFTLTGSIILILLSLFIDDIVKIQIFGRTLIASSYWGGLQIVPVILLGYLFNGLYVVFTAGIFIKEKSLYVPFITGFGAVINIVSNFALIPLLGIMGAALSTLASYIFMAAGFYFVTQKFYKINYEYGKLLKIFSAIFLAGAAYYLLLYSGNLIFIYKFLIFLFFLIFISAFVFDKNEISFLKRKLAKIKIKK